VWDIGRTRFSSGSFLQVPSKMAGVAVFAVFK